MKLNRRVFGFAVAWAVLTAALNLHFVDLGETYVSRNMGAWMIMSLLAAVLWWRPLHTGNVTFNRQTALCLALLPAGAVCVVAVNILGFDSYHLGHFFLPGMTLIFALLALGLQQKQISEEDWSLGVLVLLLAFLPQFTLHWLVGNPLVFFNFEFSMPRLFFKPYAGFGQYNLYGSFLSSILLLATWAITFLPMPQKRRWLMFGLLAFYALDMANLLSKTAILGFVVGFALMVAHMWVSKPTVDRRNRFLMCLAIVIGAAVLTGLAVPDHMRTGLTASGWTAGSGSVQTRLAMWIISWRSFLEAPLFGHGLGSYLLTYIDHFGRYGVEDGLTFYPVVSIPHNMVMHVLSETGLFGTALLLGPLFALLFFIFRQSANRLLVLALVAPVALHCLVEYPYVASGMHWLMVAVGIAAGLFGTMKTEEVPVLSNWTHNQRRASVGAVSAVSGAAFAVALYMGVVGSQAARNYTIDMKLPLSQFTKTRYERPELSHPVIGRRMTAMSDLHLAANLMRTGQNEMLAGVGIPRLEQNVLPYYASPGVWEVALTAYGVVGDRKKFLAFLDKVGRYDPALQEKFRRRFLRATGAGR